MGENLSRATRFNSKYNNNCKIHQMSHPTSLVIYINELQVFCAALGNGAPSVSKPIIAFHPQLLFPYM